ncbi:MAG: DUF4168 domain-containing protein [Allosphingosinicella sp.]
MIVSKTAARCAAAAAALTLASPALAQASAPAAQPQQAAAVSDEQLRSFANAWLELSRIDQQFAPRMEGANAEQKQALEAEAQARMAAAVERHDLDAPTFNRIAAAAEQDPEMARKIGEYAREAASAP